MDALGLLTGDAGSGILWPASSVRGSLKGDVESLQQLGYHLGIKSDTDGSAKLSQCYQPQNVSVTCE